VSKNLSFWGHLEELRRMFFRTAVVLAALMVVIFLNKSFVFDTIILAPRSSDFILYRWLCALSNYLPFDGLCGDSFKITLININLTSQFFIHLSTSFYVAVVLGFPYLIWEIWRFISPALYPNEQRSIRRGFFFSSFLFYTGVAVGYLLIFPLTIQFLGNYQVSDAVPNQISLQSYISTLTSLVLAMGIVFELPMLVLVLSHMGIVNRKFMRRYRRHALVALLLLSVIITPADVFSTIMATIPLYLLYEFSIFICKE